MDEKTIRRAIRHLNAYIGKIRADKNAYVRDIQVATIIPEVEESIAALEGMLAELQTGDDFYLGLDRFADLGGENDDLAEARS